MEEETSSARQPWPKLNGHNGGLPVHGSHALAQPSVDLLSFIDPVCLTGPGVGKIPDWPQCAFFFFICLAYFRSVGWCTMYTLVYIYKVPYTAVRTHRHPYAHTHTMQYKYLNLSAPALAVMSCFCNPLNPLCGPCY